MSIESLASFECVELEGESYDLRREHNAIREAERSGCEVFRGDSHTLVFDLDSEEARDTFLSRCDFLRSKFGMTHLLITKSTGGNYHAVAELHESLHLTQELALVIQACPRQVAPTARMGGEVCICGISGPSLMSAIFSWPPSAHSPLVECCTVPLQHGPDAVVQVLHDHEQLRQRLVHARLVVKALH